MINLEPVADQPHSSWLAPWSQPPSDGWWCALHSAPATSHRPPGASTRDLDHPSTQLRLDDVDQLLVRASLFFELGCWCVSQETMIFLEQVLRLPWDRGTGHSPKTKSALSASHLPRICLASSFFPGDHVRMKALSSMIIQNVWQIFLLVDHY